MLGPGFEPKSSFPAVRGCASCFPFPWDLVENTRIGDDTAVLIDVVTLQRVGNVALIGVDCRSPLVGTNLFGDRRSPSGAATDGKHRGC